jgi:XTP/dITP diphosphohydrolase
MREIIFATNNANKAKEVNQILGDSFKVKTLHDIGYFDEIEETGNTFYQNAYIKAKQAFDFTGLPSFGDDSGLEVEFLDGAPGVYSARYAGESRNSKANNDKLLKALEQAENRKALFVTVICYVDKTQTKYFEGFCKGQILKELRGENGFGYDPVFLPDGYDQTFAQMPVALKNSISHRAKAMEHLIDFLKNS